jgi:hypothetical protein
MGLSFSNISVHLVYSLTISAQTLKTLGGGLAPDNILISGATFCLKSAVLISCEIPVGKDSQA